MTTANPLDEHLSATRTRPLSARDRARVLAALAVLGCFPVVVVGYALGVIPR